METEKFQHKYRIPSARASWHDYSGGEYFITICTVRARCVETRHATSVQPRGNHYFGEIQNGEMTLNGLGQKLDALIRDIPIHNPYAEIPVYQVMPNHVHLIVCIDGGGGGDCRDAACHVSTAETAETNQPPVNEKMRDIAECCGLLSTAMGGLKSALTKFANTNKIDFGWQTRFYDHIIRNQEEMNRIAAYIENNPLTWKDDKFYTE